MTWGRKIVGICIMLIVAVGCTEFPDCQDTRVQFMRAEFNVKSTNLPVSISFDEVRAVGTSTPIYIGETVRTFHLHLNPQDTITTFQFISDGFVDNLTVAYKSKLILTTPDCGPVQYFYDLWLVGSSFDSVVVRSRVVDLNRPVNVQIYF